MERNTFATTIFAQTPAELAFAYLRRLEHLDEWTLGSRMVHRIDDDTAMGTASGYQSALCYHVRTLPHDHIFAIEWQCGYRFGEYFKQYPVFVFPSRYFDPKTEEQGSYIHWISVIDPARRTPMIMEGIAAVHGYEGRALKAALERARGLRAPAQPQFRLEADTIWVDAPLELGRAELSDVSRLASWSPLFRPGAEPGSFRDEYDRAVEVRFTAHELADYVLIEQDFHAPELGRTQRCPVVLLPCERAFGPGARGFLLHRMALSRDRDAPGSGPRALDLTAENMALKRRLESQAGHSSSFALGMSYRGSGEVSPPSAAPPDIFSNEFAADPYPLYQVMRDEYPLYFHLPTRAWILSRYADVRAALTSPSFSTQSYATQTEPLLGKTLIQLDGREHALHRSLLSPSFRAGVLRERIEPAIRATVDELLAEFLPRGSADLVAEFAAQLPVRIMARLLGFPARDQDRFPGWYTALIRGALNLTRDPGLAQAALVARDELDAYLRPLIRERRADPGPDLISGLLAAEVEGQRLDEEAIVRFAMLMVFAAGETTEKGLSTTLRNLLARPYLLKAVRERRALLPRAIAESFRLTAPTHMVPRHTTTEVVVSGGVIPAGSEVLCFLGAANRDERRFERPDCFELDRSESDPERAFTGQAAHLAFGGGRHFCLGALLSRLEIEVALSALLDRADGLRLDGDVPADVGLFLRGPRSLPVSFRPSAT